MEQKKTMPTPIALIIGIVIGVALTLAGLFLYKIGTEGVPAMSNGGEASQSENVSSAVPEGETSQLENTSSAESENADSSAPAGGGDTAFYPLWSADAQYNGGDRVTCDGGVYEAKWWTAGESPADNQSGVWERVGDASPEAGASTEEEPFIGEPSELKNPKSSEFKVVGYFPSWKPAELDKVRYDVLTHINYSFLIPTAEGGVRELDNPNTAKKLIDEAHKNGVRVLIAVGGWSYNEIPLEPTFVAATSSDEKIKQFGDAILKVCDEYGFDGVDMDWEHPRRDGNTSAQYEKLMVYLGEKLHAEGKLLTSAVLSGATPDGGVYYDAAAHTDKVLTTVDWINVMAYDGGDGDRHSSYEFAVNCVDYWRNKRSMPAEKVVLGVPFYARPSWASYEEILAANPDAYKSDKSTFKGMEACYNGYDTIKKKTRHAKQNAGGVMIWEIAQDTRDKEKSLMSAIAEGMK